MFERLRHFYHFFKTYRAARKAGQDHEGALDQATRQTMEDAAARGGRDDTGEEKRQLMRGVGDVAIQARRGEIDEKEIGRAVAGAFATAAGEDTSDWPTFSDDLRDQWCRGEDHYVAHNGLDIESYQVGFLALDITPAHLELIRRMRFVWDGTEVGAPMLDPERPYGERNLFGQIGRAFGEDSEAGQLARHVEMMIALNHFLANATLAPGAWALANISPKELRAQFEGYNGGDGVNDEDVGLSADGSFQFAPEHARLVQQLSVEWSNRYDNEDRLDCGQYPGLAVDPKRPYGDMTYFQVDMARALGVLPPPPEDGSPARLPSALEERLGRLHWQMLGALQVFVANAELAPGTYSFD